MTEQQRRILKRFAAGDCPRCSLKLFWELSALLPGLFNLESAHGADRSGGMLLIPMSWRESKKSTDAVAAFLAANPPTETS